MSGGREAVLARVRAALGPAAAVPEVPRAYREASALDARSDSSQWTSFASASRTIGRP